MTVGIFCLLCGTATLQSCSKDDGPVTKSKTEDIDWGRFEGFIDGKEYSVQNTPYPERNILISSIRIGARPLDSSTSYFSGIDAMQTSILLEENLVLSVYLYNLMPGTREIISFTPPLEGTYNRVELVRFEKNAEGEEYRVSYRPGANCETSFHVEITDVIWVTPSSPIVEAKLSGSLYNKEKSSDSIYINAEYSAR
ncbi:MAG: DUF5025 domain-containing protein [Odoribacteraceae bacterium]|jgi:hypothetical protein|nr:DUF5025 domain-containing protein [Odoribacteraceae bacterium]